MVYGKHGMIVGKFVVENKFVRKYNLLIDRSICTTIQQKLIRKLVRHYFGLQSLNHRNTISLYQQRLNLSCNVLISSNEFNLGQRLDIRSSRGVPWSCSSSLVSVRLDFATHCKTITENGQAIAPLKIGWHFCIFQPALPFPVFDQRGDRKVPTLSRDYASLRNDNVTLTAIMIALATITLALAAVLLVSAKVTLA